jgi:hypothetical protein
MDVIFDLVLRQSPSRVSQGSVGLVVGNEWPGPPRIVAVPCSVPNVSIEPGQESLPGVPNLDAPVGIPGGLATSIRLLSSGIARRAESEKVAASLGPRPPPPLAIPEESSMSRFIDGQEIDDGHLQPAHSETIVGKP